MSNSKSDAERMQRDHIPTSTVGLQVGDCQRGGGSLLKGRSKGRTEESVPGVSFAWDDDDGGLSTCNGEMN